MNKLFITLGITLLLTVLACGAGSKTIYYSLADIGSIGFQLRISCDGLVSSDLINLHQNVSVTVEGIRNLESYNNTYVTLEKCSVLSYASYKSVKIGLLSPQTGPIAQYAPGFEDAADGEYRIRSRCLEFLT